MTTEQEVNQAFEKEFDGVEPFLLVQEILETRAENARLKEKADIVGEALMTFRKEVDIVIKLNKSK